MGFTMNVNIVFGEDGARDATRRDAVVVVIDALRASATAATALALGARKVIPAGTIEEARSYRGRSRYVIAGERNGVKIPDFDFGNSPTELRHHQHLIAGKTLVLTTSNGTRVVRAADGARVILMGTTINARATAQAAFEFAREHERDIALVATGENGKHAEEDFVGARQIARALSRLGANVVPADCKDEDALAVFLRTHSAHVLFELGYDADVHYCARSNVYAVAPWLTNGGFIGYEPAQTTQQPA